MVSAMTGEFVAGPELDAGYWYASLRSTVQFARATEVLGRAGYGVFIETSAHPVLTTAIGETLEALASDGETSTGPKAAVVSGTLRRDDGGPDRLLASLAEVYVRGVGVDWAAVLPAGARVDLPTYAFQRRTFWIESAKTADITSPAETEFWAAVEGGDLAGLSDTLAVETDRPFHEVLPMLASWRQRARGEATSAGWHYGISWPVLPNPEPVPLNGTWLLITGPTGSDVARKCAGAVQEAGAEVVLVEVGAGETSRGELAAQLDPELPLTGVVSLLALEHTPAIDAPVMTAGLAGTLALIQALGEQGIEAPLWVVTQGAVAVEPGEVLVAPGQSAVWGLGRVAGLELSERWGGLIDLPVVVDQSVTDRLIGIVGGTGGEDQVAVRATGVRGRRLVRRARNGRATRWVPAGTVLVTGGTGAIGGRVAAWVARRGASRVVLSSRSGPQASGCAELVAGLAEAGAVVEVVACDSADREPTAALLARIDQSGPGLDAVFHVAGTSQVNALRDMTVAHLSDVATAKVAGAVNLDELTSGRELSAFVTFSSGAAVWGSAMQGGYAAANAFLDGLAQRRRGRGLAGTSVAWGLWGGGGMGQGEGGARLQRLGLREMDPSLSFFPCKPRTTDAITLS
jgi:acyl transferase domain-containing protein